jgi:hypothetical protein
MEGGSSPNPTLGHQFAKAHQLMSHRNYQPKYITTENNFVPLSPELRVKSIDAVISDNGMTLREMCLKRLKE